MDLVSIELGIAMLLLFVVPIVYAVTNQSRKEKKTIKKVETLCGLGNIKLTSSAILHTLFIGIDENSKTLVTSTVPVKEEHIDVFPLKEVKSCSLIKIQIPKPGQPNASTIEKVAIEISFKDKLRKNHQIIFFDDEIGIEPLVSLNQASSWLTLIQDNLK
ncbi:MAG: hypothetical protein NXH73_05335 [Flavobacteriaceae bacterium]|nr:hypothetical protein [Flavobacteriaceae bacterium]